MPSTQAKAAPAATNGNGQPADPLAQAIAYEHAIAAEALELRGDATEMTPALFLQLLPLLRKPIPAGFIVETEAVKGKPYQSTGIKSLQVQINRLDNVLTPLTWHWVTEWSEDGRTATVDVRVLDGEGKVLVARRARGGVNQASTDGNLLKGSETNAAKLAFARLGVGHEVYTGATDFDPDVDKDAADLQTTAPAAKAETPVIDGDRVAELVDLAHAWVTQVEGDDQEKRKKQITRLLRSEGLTGALESVSQGLARLSPVAADNVETWLREQKGGEQS